MKKWRTCIALALAAVLWTLAVMTIDVRAIGLRKSEVGFASLNAWAHRLTGAHMALYEITDWLGLVPAAVALGFAALGLVQWIRRRSLLKVNFSILILGLFYLAVMAVYLLFEALAVNYRPVLIDGRLEASYPSSTTLLTLCVMSTAVMQLRGRIKNAAVRRWTTAFIHGFTAFMVVGRLISGVHWLTDIVGGALISAALVAGYRAIVHRKPER